MFTHIDEVYAWLYTQKKLKKREDLSRIQTCAKELALIPNYKIIHIAGTNGKGSTACFIKNILKTEGDKVGLFVSPYVVMFNERIQINDTYVSDDEILSYGNEIYLYAEEYKRRTNDVIPFFELTLLFALKHFKKHKIDIAIFECGMGGLLDATNFLNSDLTIITNVGYDHMNSLGNTLLDIAIHKLGIMKNSVPCLTCVHEALRPLFLEHAKKKNVPLVFVDLNVKDIDLKENTSFKYKDVYYEASLYGKYQAYNASLAIEAVQYFHPQISSSSIQKGLLETFWPGRMEKISINPEIILDGAHNIHGVRALIDTMKEMKSNRKNYFVFSALRDKAFDQMLPALDEIADAYYFTTIEDARAMDPKEFCKYVNKEAFIYEKMEDCIDAVMNLDDKHRIIVTGSLHFISLARAYFIKKYKKNIS